MNTKSVMFSDKVNLFVRFYTIQVNLSYLSYFVTSLSIHLHLLNLGFTSWQSNPLKKKKQVDDMKEVNDLTFGDARVGGVGDVAGEADV